MPAPVLHPEALAGIFAAPPRYASLEALWLAAALFLIPVVVAGGVYWLVRALSPSDDKRVPLVFKIFAYAQIFGFSVAALTILLPGEKEAMNKPLLEIFTDGLCYYPTGNAYNRFLAWHDLRIEDNFSINSKEPYIPPKTNGRERNSYLPLTRRNGEEIRLPLERFAASPREIRVLLGQNIALASARLDLPTPRKCTTLPD